MLSPPVPGSTAANTTKDELIIELLASEAVVDSREYDILGAEQVEELKKVCSFPLLGQLLDWDKGAPLLTPNLFRNSNPCQLQSFCTSHKF